jgi:hypothetical protein
MSVTFAARQRLLMRAKQDSWSVGLLRLGQPRRFSKLIAGPSTEIVIEGFMRSATTFAVNAFRLAQQPRHVRIAHHVHAPAQFQIAARHGIPAMCLVRDPSDTVTSMIIRDPRLSIGLALEMYRRFYARTLDLADAFVVCSFAEVTQDFGTSIHRLNDRFGCAWKPFDGSRESVDAVLDRIRRVADVRIGGDTRMMSAPSADREAPARELRERLRAPGVADPLARANSLYERMMRLA